LTIYCNLKSGEITQIENTWDPRDPDAEAGNSQADGVNRQGVADVLQALACMQDLP